MNVLISLGEIVDKLTILEIKQKKVDDQSKIIEIEKEINELKIDQKYKDSFYYDILLFINEEIWNMTDKIKKIKWDENPVEFAKISNDIFEFNQKRFRIKNLFNIIYNSHIKEQKSYENTYCKIILNSKEEVYSKIKEINYLSIDYDYIVFESNKALENNFELDFLEDIFVTPNFIINNKLIIKSYNKFNWENYISYYKDLIPAGINTYESALSHFNNFGKNENRYADIVTKEISVNNFNKIINISDISDISDIFDFKPLNYISGGLLGDFIHNLGIIYEYYYKFARKGNLYVSNTGDPFRLGLEFTYNDTYELVKNQKYIINYEIHNNQKIDVNLDYWREFIPTITYGERCNDLYSRIYSINWGMKKWFFMDSINPFFSNRVLINTTKSRFPNTTYYYTFSTNGPHLEFNNLVSQFGNDLLYISPNEEEYEYFKSQTGIELEYYKPIDFYELCLAINSCKLFIGSYSAPLAIATALDVNRIPQKYIML